LDQNQEENEENELLATIKLYYPVYLELFFVASNPNSRGEIVEPDAPNESIQETEAADSKSFFSRLGGVYFSPGETFREIGRSPGVFVPIVVLVTIGLLAGYYVTKHLDLQSMMSAQLENAVQQGNISQEQMEQQLSLISRFTGVMVTVSAGLGSLAISLIVAGFAKLFSLFVGAENRFKPVFSVTLYTMIAVSIIQSILLVVILYFKNPGDISPTNVNSLVASNLGAVFAGIMGGDVLPKFLMNLAGYVDLFAIWRIALLAIGYSAVSRKLKTATAAAWLVAGYAVIAVIGSFASLLRSSM
jgi:hypothetical protein